MYDQQRFRLSRETAANLFRVWAEIPVLDVNEDRPRLEPPHGFHVSNERIGRENHFIPFTHAARCEPKNQGLRTRSHTDNTGNVEKACHLSFKAPHLLAIQELWSL
jgi:hypothetical protein